jgi:hypothetical protein
MKHSNGHAGQMMPKKSSGISMDQCIPSHKLYFYRYSQFHDTSAIKWPSSVEIHIKLHKNCKRA